MREAAGRGSRYTCRVGLRFCAKAQAMAGVALIAMELGDAGCVARGLLLRAVLVGREGSMRLVVHGEACGGAMVVVRQCVGRYHGDACHEEDEGNMPFAAHLACWFGRKDRAKRGDTETFGRDKSKGRTWKSMRPLQELPWMAVFYQMDTLLSLGMYIGSASVMPNASYHASICGRMPLTRHLPKEWTSMLVR